MTSTATATIDPTYGLINGYTDQYVFQQPASVANVITVPASSVIQFVNLEPLPPSPNPPATPQVIFHSAAALPTAFPLPSYSFPPQEHLALGAQIGASPWSTGLVGQDTTGLSLCYSQPFTLPAGTGTYEFGDLQYFGLSNTRDVIVVSGAVQSARQQHHALRRATPPP